MQIKNQTAEYKDQLLFYNHLLLEPVAPFYSVLLPTLIIRREGNM
jgi:hypothetical protein